MNKRLIQKNKTRERRKSQTCKVYEVKIDRSHLSTAAKHHLSSLFREAKWFYNYCLSNEDLAQANTTLRKVPVKVGEEYETRYFDALSSQMKQGIKTRLFGSLMSLSALKKKGHKVGRLKFKSECNSIPLVQLNGTHYIKNNRIRLQGMKRWLKVNGLEQIPSEAEIACANLIRKGGGYYIHITTYTSIKKAMPPEASIGIDFGCETQLAFSNGVKVQFQVEPTKRLKRLDRKVMKKRRKKSNNKFKDNLKRRKEYEKLTNRRKDIRHKLVNAITKNYRYVCFQDESIHAWAMSGHGKKIQFSGIGGIISDLKHKSHTPLEVNKFFPSTQLCPNCGSKQKLSLDERTYDCDCGFVMDRDWKSAICLETEGLKQIPTERREFTPGEIPTSTFFEKLSQINGVKASKPESLSQEAPPSLAAG